jgi:acetylornithine deacetylase
VIDTASAGDPLELAIRLMEVDSTSGDEGRVIELAHGLLAADGWRVTRIPVSPGRDSILALPANAEPGAPLVTFCTHLDTVPPYIPPRLDGDVLWGRGACDAKGIAAAMTCAARVLRDRGVPAALLFVIGEETTHDGAHAANEYARGLAAAGHPPGVIIDGEPTESTLAVGTKGAIRIILRTAGRAAHSAYPHLGHSATRDLVRLLADLDALELPCDDLLGETTVNIGVISGGVADNVIAPSAEARLMIRLVTDADDVVARVQRWVGDRADVERGVMVPPVRLSVVDGFPTSVAAFATDIPALGNWGTPYLFGPGSIHVAHTRDEHVSVAELRSAVGAYVRIAELSAASAGLRAAGPYGSEPAARTS